jgi:hypothetical protein
MKYEYTNQSPELFAGFYDSVLHNYDLEAEIAEYKADDSGMEYEIADWSGYQNSIAENCAEWLFNHLPNHDIIKAMKYKELWSPMYYNFETDKLTLDCDIDLDGLKNYCLQANRDDFSKYLFENWSSRDGFVSFVENDILEFEKDPDITIMIEFYLLREIDLEQYERFCYDLANDTIFNYLEPVKENDEKPLDNNK